MNTLELQAYSQFLAYAPSWVKGLIQSSQVKVMVSGEDIKLSANHYHCKALRMVLPSSVGITTGELEKDVSQWVSSFRCLSES